MAEVGVSLEEFAEACEQAQHNPHAKEIFEQILAADDYISVNLTLVAISILVGFKKMMTKRNCQLEEEANK